MKQTIIDNEFAFDVDKIIQQENLNEHPRFQRFFQIAKSVSELSTYERYRLGAVIVLKGVIIARGYNKTKTHPTQKKYNAKRFTLVDNSNHYLHAEIDALNKVRHLDLSQAEIYIYHIGNSGNQKLARPCVGCMGAIKDSGIKKIHYSTPDGLASEYLNKDHVFKFKKSSHTR